LIGKLSEQDVSPGPGSCPGARPYQFQSINHRLVDLRISESVAGQIMTTSSEHHKLMASGFGELGREQPRAPPVSTHCPAQSSHGAA